MRSLEKRLDALEKGGAAPFVVVLNRLGESAAAAVERWERANGVLGLRQPLVVSFRSGLTILSGSTAS